MLPFFPELPNPIYWLPWPLPQHEAYVEASAGSKKKKHKPQPRVLQRLRKEKENQRSNGLEISGSSALSKPNSLDAPSSTLRIFTIVYFFHAYILLLLSFSNVWSLHFRLLSLSGELRSYHAERKRAGARKGKRRATVSERERGKVGRAIREVGEQGRGR